MESGLGRNKNDIKGVEGMKHCIYCQRPVKAARKFSWIWFLIFCLTGIGGFVYLLYFPFKKKQCPICGGKHFEPIDGMGSWAREGLKH